LEVVYDIILMPLEKTFGILYLRVAVRNTLHELLFRQILFYAA